jgi:threonine/homoserine/homoserine lactone efflux protein
MNGQTWAIFVGASMALALAPGPDILTVLTRSVTQGITAGLVAAAGFASGLTVHTTLAALGVAAIMQASPHAMQALRWFGAAYLLYLALRVMLNHDPINLHGKGARTPQRRRSIYAQSVLMNVLNPKVTLFFLGFLPGFVEKSGAPAWMQIVMLGCVFALCTVICFGGCALFAGSISGWLRRRPGAGAWLKWITAAVFVAVAVWIAGG